MYSALVGSCHWQLPHKVLMHIALVANGLLRSSTDSPGGDARLGATEWVVLCRLATPGCDVARHHACSGRAAQRHSPCTLCFTALLRCDTAANPSANIGHLSLVLQVHSRLSSSKA